MYFLLMYFNVLRFINFDIKYTKKINKIEKDNNRTWNSTLDTSIIVINATTICLKIDF